MLLPATLVSPAAISTASVTVLIGELTILATILNLLERQARATKPGKVSPERSADVPPIVPVGRAAAALGLLLAGFCLLTSHLAGWERAAIAAAVLISLLALSWHHLPLPGVERSGRLDGWLWTGIAAAVLVTAAFLVVSAKPAASTGVTFPVYGTCLSGGCGLRQRTGPGPQYPTVGRLLPDGTRVTIACRAKGDPIAGHRSPWWDRLVSGPRVRPGSYVSDAYIDHPRDGGPPYIQLCTPGKPDA